MKICKANNQLCLKLEVKLLYKDFKTSEEKWSYDLGAGSWEYYREMSEKDYSYENWKPEPRTLNATRYTR